MSKARDQIDDIYKIDGIESTVNGLDDVATTGQYSSLVGTPTFKTVNGIVVEGTGNIGTAPRSSQTFTASGTWTKPAGVTQIRVQLVGGGGGSGGNAESGGAGGYCEKIIDVTSVTSVAITVGLGGNSSTYNVVNYPGGTTSFGSFCSASGGGGSCPVVSRHCGGVGGLGVGGDLNLYGGGGTGHDGNAGAVGGISYFGGSEPGCHADHRANLPHYGYAPGAGAVGSYTTHSQRMPRGGDGMVIVWEH